MKITSLFCCCPEVLPVPQSAILFPQLVGSGSSVESGKAEVEVCRRKEPHVNSRPLIIHTMSIKHLNLAQHLQRGTKQLCCDLKCLMASFKQVTRLAFKVRPVALWIQAALQGLEASPLQCGSDMPLQAGTNSRHTLCANIQAQIKATCQVGMHEKHASQKAGHTLHFTSQHAVRINSIYTSSWEAPQDWK